MIVLIGFMGAGKSTIGRTLADRLRLPFLDSDQVIEHQQGQSVREIFDRVGEPGFRDVEAQVIAALLDGPTAVLSLGGGACGRAGTRDLLTRHVVIHLEVDLAEARRRTADDPARPMLQRPDLAELFAQRSEVYRTLADLEVSTNGRGVDDVVRELLTHLGHDVGPDLQRDPHRAEITQ